jgi:hypothetical protein
LDFRPDHLDYPDPFRVRGAQMRREQVGKRLF